MIVVFMLHLVSEEQPLVVPASYHYMILLIVPTEAKTKSILRWIGDDYFDTYTQNTNFQGRFIKVFIRPPLHVGDWR